MNLCMVRIVSLVIGAMAALSPPLADVAAQTAHAASPFDRSAWLSDYALLKSQLVLSYSHLAWFGAPESGVDLPSLDRRTTRALRHASSEAEARAAVLGFVSSFHDGHFTATAAPEVGGGAAEPPQPTIYTDAPTACAAYGYAPTTRIQFSLPFETLPGFALYADGLSGAFRSGIVENNGVRLGIVRIPRFRAREYPALCMQLWSMLHARGAQTSAEAIANEVDAAWLQTLAARLRQFRAEHVAAVIVDIGGNGGGNDLGDWAVRAFTAQPVRSAPLLLAAGPVAVPFLDEQLGRLRETLNTSGDLAGPSRDALRQAINAFERRRQAADQPACDMSWVWRERRTWGTSACTRLIEAGYASGQRDYAEIGAFESPAAGALYWASIADGVRGAWEGPTYVLTDAGTGSAAEMFAALIRDRGVARIIGAHTSGDGCGFMDSAAPFVLPHSRLAISIPNCVRLRSDGTDEVAGIAPDVQIAPLPGESIRARAARVVDVVASDLSQ